MYKNSAVFKVRRVACDVEQESGLCRKTEVDGFPSIIVYKNSKAVGEFVGNRNIPELVDFIESHRTEEQTAEWVKREAKREIEEERKQEEKAERKRLLALAEAEQADRV